MNSVTRGVLSVEYEADDKRNEENFDHADEVINAGSAFEGRGTTDQENT